MTHFPHIQGLVAAPHTAMYADGSVNLGMIEKQAAALASAGVAGAFVCGTTGEGQSMTADERMKVAARWREAAGGNLKVIVHVGHTSGAEAQALAAHAQQIGADAIAALGPFFFKPGLNELVAFCADLAAAAPRLPFYYYHIPSMTGVNVKVHDLLAAGGDKIPTLAGAKFTCEDLMDFGRCVRMQDGRFDMLFGRDEILLAGLSMGAKGGVGTTYNYAAALYLDIIHAFATGDLARAQAQQARSIDFIQVLVKYGGTRASKAIMKMTGIDCGPARLPLAAVGEQEYHSIHTDLERIGFFTYCTKA